MFLTKLFGSREKDKIKWLESVIESMGDEVIVINKNYEIVLANNRKRERFGEDIVGKQCYDVFEQTDGPCENCPAIRSIGEGKIVHADWEYTHRETGEKFVADLVVAPIMQDNKQTDFAVEIVRDSTIRNRVYEVTLEIQEASTEEEITKIFMDAVVQKMGFDRARFYVIERDDILKLKSFRGMQDRNELRALELKAGEGLSQRTINNAAPIFFKICDAVEADQRNENEKNPFVTWIAPEQASYEELLKKDIFPMWVDLPLITGAEVIGKLTLDKVGSDWDVEEYDLQILGLFAANIAQALEKTRLSILDVLGNISIALLKSEQNLKDTLDVILKEGLLRLIKPDIGCVLLWEDANRKDKLKVVASTNDSEGTVLKLDNSVCGEAAQKKEIININNVESYPRYKKVGKQEMGSELAAPMILGNKVIGVINAESREKNNFTKKHELLINLLSNNAAIAIQNAERHQQLTKAVEVANKSLSDKDAYIRALQHELIAPLDPMLATFAFIEKALAGIPLDDLLEKRRVSSERLRHIFRDGINECKQLSFMLEGIDILGGNLEPDLREGQIFRDVIIPVISILKATAEKERKYISWSDFENVPTFYFDKKLISHVFINLLTNAIKYSDEDTYINIEGLDTGRATIEIAVENSGIGIPPGWEEKIFGRDVRAPNVKEAGHTGVGIGLTIAKMIVEAHKGKIYVENNRNPTIFVVALPK